MSTLTKDRPGKNQPGNFPSLLLSAAWVLAAASPLIAAPGDPGGRCSATLYEHANFTGRHEKISADVATLRGHSIGNDRVSSVRLSPGCRLVLYQDDGFHGRSTELTEDRANLTGSQVGNDAVSSLRLFSATPAEAEPRPCDDLGVHLAECRPYECDVQSRITGEQAVRRVVEEADQVCVYIEEETAVHTISCKLSAAERAVASSLYSWTLAGGGEADRHEFSSSLEEFEKMLHDESVCRFFPRVLPVFPEPHEVEQAKRWKTEKAIWDMQGVGEALMRWMTIQLLEGKNGVDPQTRDRQGHRTWRVTSSIAETSYRTLSQEDVGRLLVPGYLREVPGVDPWGHPYEYAVTDDFFDRNVVAARSAGADGRFDTDRYARAEDRFLDDESYMEKLFADTNRDIVWADGFINPQDQPLGAVPGIDVALVKTIQEMDDIGIAMMAWLTDHFADQEKPWLADADLGSWLVREEKEPYTETSFRVISFARLEKLLIPAENFFYLQELQELSETDGWGEPYQFAISDDLLGKRVLAIRSAGRDRRFDSDAYPLRGVGSNRFQTFAAARYGHSGRDLVWLDGYFVAADP